MNIERKGNTYFFSKDNEQPDINVIFKRLEAIEASIKSIEVKLKNVKE